jgi:diguanylate cyclase (GGDEF)-like protein/PAS domain S-box-containing protein
MHHLLERQLKKSGANVDEGFLKLVEQAYMDADEDRALLERSLDISSMEMKELYEQLEKNAADKLRKSEERYNKLVQALRKYYFFYAHDTNGIFVYLSDSLEEILGYTREEFSQHYSTYLTEDEINKNVSYYTEEALKGNQQKPYVISVYRKNRSVCYLEVTEFPVFNADGEVIEIEGIAKDITSQYIMQKELDYISQHDSLTGILNRLSLYNKLEYIIASSKRQQQHFAVLFLDFDHFKEINDSLGHHVGDLLLREGVNRIKSCIRESDIFARIGGDEFVIILTVIDEKYISKIASQIIEAIQKPFHIKNHNINISTSMGISLYPKDEQSVQSLLKSADEAMYKAKTSGRNTFKYYSE